MKFKVGNKVRLRDKALLKMGSSPLAKIYRSEGRVVWTGTKYTKVLLSNGVTQWFTNSVIQLTKNQQLYFDFV